MLDSPFQSGLVVPLGAGGLTPYLRRQRDAGGGGGSSTAAITSGAGASLRNNFSDYVGFKFTPSSNMTVTHLGRWKVSGNTGTHTVRIIAFGSGTLLGSVSVDLTLFPAGDYAYVALASSVALTSGVDYYVASLEVSGGDNWYDHFDVTSTADIGSIVSAFGLNSLGSAGKSFVPVNFKYTIP